MIFSILLLLAIIELRPVLMTATTTSSVTYKKVLVTEDSLNQMMINNFMDAVDEQRYGGF